MATRRNNKEEISASQAAHKLYVVHATHTYALGGGKTHHGTSRIGAFDTEQEAIEHVESLLSRSYVQGENEIGRPVYKIDVE